MKTSLKQKLFISMLIVAICMPTYKVLSYENWCNGHNLPYFYLENAWYITKISMIIVYYNNLVKIIQWI